MEIRIAATLVDTLRYRLYAQASMPAEGDVHVDVVPVVGGVPAEPASARARRGAVTEPPAALIAPAMLKPAEFSAAIRALRERTLREVQQQLEHFCRTTGREWCITRLHYGELMPEPGVREDARTCTTRLTLVTDVELGARMPTLH